MTTPQQTAASESAAAARKWEVGGSDLHQPEMPGRRAAVRNAKPPQEPKETKRALMPAFDEALEHVNWCRQSNMTPQCVADSVCSREVAHTWSEAVRIIEAEILSTRLKSGQVERYT